MSTPTSNATSEASAGPPSGAAAGPPRRSNRLSVGNMVRSLGLLLVIVFAVVFFQQVGGQAVHVVDPSQTYLGAQRLAHYPIRVPQGLDKDWRCTSARDVSSGNGQLTLYVGYVTPADQYAEVVQSDETRSAVFDQTLAADAQQQGNVMVNGVPWQRYPAKKSGEIALTRTAGGVTYVVTGNASVRELTTLAGSLRPYSGPGAH